MPLATIANNTAVNYQRLQYFLTEANRDTRKLKDIHILLLQNQRTTRTSNKGILATDAWYTSTELIEFVASKNVYLTAEVEINRSIFFTHPQTKQRRYLTGDKIIPLIKEFYPHKLKTAAIPQADETNKNVLYYAFKSKLKDCSTKVQVIFIFDKWSGTDDKDIHILITTDLVMSVRSIILTYLLR